jgi:hypothetical protein
MTFWKGLRTSYGGSLAFLAACPLLALVPVVFELLQHVAEVHIGMYDSIAAAKALEHHPLRMALGMVKVLALLVPTYWITRFVHTRDPRFAARRDPLAMRLFAGVVAIHIALSAAQLFGLPQTPAALLAGLAGGLIVQCLLVAWTVAATLGDASIGPVASVRIMARRLPWTIAFTVVAMLPLMIPHYLLGAAAIMAPRVWLWPILTVDALLVGWLCAVMAASNYVAAMRAIGLAGGALRPSGVADVAGPTALAPYPG